METCGNAEDTAAGEPRGSPGEGAGQGGGRESWAKGKREAELEVIGGRGEGPAVPTLGKRVEGAAVVSISCLQLSQSLCHRTPSPPGAAAGLAALTTATIVAALSAAASFLVFLPAPDRAAVGTGSSCLARQPLSCRPGCRGGGEAGVKGPGSADRQAGLHPPR